MKPRLFLALASAGIEEESRSKKRIQYVDPSSEASDPNMNNVYNTMGIISIAVTRSPEYFSWRRLPRWNLGETFTPFYHFSPDALLSYLPSVPLPGFSQEFPTKPITIYCGYAAGATTDITARGLAAALRKCSGCAVVVENKAGGGATVAAGLVASKKAGWIHLRGCFHRSDHGTPPSSKAVLRSAERFNFDKPIFPLYWSGDRP